LAAKGSVGFIKTERVDHLLYCEREEARVRQLLCAAFDKRIVQVGTARKQPAEEREVGQACSNVRPVLRDRCPERILSNDVMNDSGPAIFSSRSSYGIILPAKIWRKNSVLAAYR